MSIRFQSTLESVFEKKAFLAIVFTSYVWTIGHTEEKYFRFQTKTGTCYLRYVFISHTVHLPKSVAEILLAATDLLVSLILALIHGKKTRTFAYTP